MKTPEDIRSALIQQITEAFAGVKRGNGVSLHEADAINGAGYGKKYAKYRAKARRLDSDQHWQDVPDKDIEEYPSILSFLDAEGFCYYAPAYMIWALKHYKTSASMSSDSIVYTFELQQNKHVDKWNLSRFDVFTAEQRRAICGFLRFMAEHGDGYADEDAALRALGGYWDQFGDANE